MAWKTVSLPARGLPEVACCYAICFNGVVKYVGSTGNLRTRFFEHGFRYGYGKNIITPWVDVPDYTSLTLKYKESKRYGYWLMLEARLIRRLQPEFNKKGRKVA